jgi:hypothetical protein
MVGLRAMKDYDRISVATSMNEAWCPSATLGDAETEMRSGLAEGSRPTFCNQSCQNPHPACRLARHDLTGNIHVGLRPMSFAVSKVKEIVFYRIGRALPLPDGRWQCVPEHLT